MVTAVAVDGISIHRANDLAVKTLTVTAAPRSSRRTRGRRPGAIIRTRFQDAALFSITGYARGDTHSDLHDAIMELRALFSVDESHVLTWRPQGWAFDLRSVVHLEGEIDAPLEGASKLVNWSLQVVSGDPFLYAADASQSAYAPTEDGNVTGLDFPLDFPIDWNGAATDDLFAVTNLGTAPAAPLLTVSGPIANPIIRNETAGRQIATTGLELLEGEHAQIDLANRRLLIGGVTERADLIDSRTTQWWELLPGENLLRMSGFGFANGSTTLTVSYRHAWRI